MQLLESKCSDESTAKTHHRGTFFQETQQCKSGRWRQKNACYHQLSQSLRRDTLYYMVALLIVSPHAEFAEQLCKWAQEVGEKACCATHKAQAVVFAHDEGCTLALLDDALGEQMLREIGEALRLVVPEIALTVLQGETDLPSLLSLRPYTLLKKPLTKEKFLAFLHGEQEVARPASPPRASPTEENAWLEDAQRAAGYLTQLTLESSAQAAMLLRDGHTWAYAGQLTQDAIRELEQVAHRIARQKAGEVLRFIHLNSTQAEHLLYLTPIEEKMLLVLLFDAETPFSVLRAQAHRLTNLLLHGPSPTPPVSFVQGKTPPPSPAITDEWPASPSFLEILGEVPAPEPESPPALVNKRESQVAPSPGTVKETEEQALPTTLTTVDVEENGSPSPVHLFSLESSPAIPLSQRKSEEADIDMLAETRRHTPGELEQTRKNTKVIPKESEAPQTPAETRPHFPGELEEHELPEPVSPARAAISFACLLIPRFASHSLTGDLASRLAEWVPAICVAYGWKLEYLSIRPDYLQWVVSVSPSTSPGTLMRLMRMQTSERIFAEFSHLKKQNPSGDFWAPGYLIMGSNQPHPPQLVRNYILEVRRRQGISPS